MTLTGITFRQLFVTILIYNKITFKRTRIRSIAVSFRNNTDVAHYNFDEDQPILTIFGRDVAERLCYQSKGDFLSHLS